MSRLRLTGPHLQLLARKQRPEIVQRAGGSIEIANGTRAGLVQTVTLPAVDTNAA